MLAAFTLAIFMAACLLFSVQPMIAKTLLPLLGGSPSVWNACMLFFQGALLAGYLYAHGLMLLRRVRTQLIVHACVLVAAFVLLPIGLPEGWEPPARGSAVGWVLMALLASVGGPFFVLASAAPLLQGWFASTTHRAASDPYFLYAASNAGSLLALLGYPLLVEPALGVSQQTTVWSVAYGGFAAAAVLSGVLAVRARAAGAGAVADVAGASAEAGETSAPLDVAPTWGTRLWWLALAFVPCSLMLGTTQHLATDVASFPLLWVGPLAIYIATFIVAFLSWGRWVTRAAELLVPPVVLAMALMMFAGVREEIRPQVVLYPVGLLVVGLACHGLLAARRPHASRLTEFYLFLSLGGVLGGVFNALVAPVAFDSIAEYPIAIALAAVVVAWSRRGLLRKWPLPVRVLLTVAVPAVVMLMISVGDALVLALGELVDAESDSFLATWWSKIQGADELWGVELERWFLGLLPVAACLLLVWVRGGFALGVAVFLGVQHFEPPEETILFQERTFFGVYRVLQDGSPDGAWHYLDHGTTRHGLQYNSGPEAMRPTTYYAYSGPVGDFVAAANRKIGRKEIAVVGLGAGTFAAHARPDWRLTFYEIDPVVVEIATNPDLFTYVTGCEGLVYFKEGDARLRIAEEADGRYDLIVLDAYASDAVPVHLITREAVQLYLRKLAPGGMIVFHVTNLHLDLLRVVTGITDDLGLVGAVRIDDDEGGDPWDNKYGSDWVVVARTKDALGPIVPDENWEWLEPDPDKPRILWTDDRSDLLGVMSIW